MSLTALGDLDAICRTRTCNDTAIAPAPAFETVDNIVTTCAVSTKSKFPAYIADYHAAIAVTRGGEGPALH